MPESKVISTLHMRLHIMILEPQLGIEHCFIVIARTEQASFFLERALHPTHLPPRRMCQDCKQGCEGEGHKEADNVHGVRSEEHANLCFGVGDRKSVV